MKVKIQTKELVEYLVAANYSIYKFPDEIILEAEPVEPKFITNGMCKHEHKADCCLECSKPVEEVKKIEKMDLFIEECPNCNNGVVLKKLMNKSNEIIERLNESRSL